MLPILSISTTPNAACLVCDNVQIAHDFSIYYYAHNIAASQTHEYKITANNDCCKNNNIINYCDVGVDKSFRFPCKTMNNGRGRPVMKIFWNK